MSKHRIAVIAVIAVIASDGIGKETMPEGIRVLDAAARKFGRFDFSSWGYYGKHGKMLTDDWKGRIGGHDAIYFGAVGSNASRMPDIGSHAGTADLGGAIAESL